jgi:hypothetical protein
MILDPKILPIRNENNKIPEDTLFNILKIYEYGNAKDIDKLPSPYICEKDGSYWTTWNRVLEIRTFLKQDKTNMNAKEEAIKLIDEINFEANGDLDGYFDNGKRIAIAILKKDYTIQQKTRLIEALKNLTLEEYEPN